MDLRTLIDLFLLDVCGGKVNQTPGAYRSKLKRLVDFFGPDREPGTITRAELERFKVDLSTRKTHMRGTKEVPGGLAPATIRTVLVTVRFLFSWAADTGYLAINPMGGVRIPSTPAPQPKAVDKDTCIKLLRAAAARGENWQRARDVALIYLLRDTGARAGGLIGAALGDMDLSHGLLMVTEKGRSHMVFMTSVTIEAVQTWLTWRAALPVQSDKIFITKAGRALSYRGFYRMLYELAQRAGLQGEKFNPHSFRHGFARDAILNGADLSQVAALMGHTDTRVTSAYYARWNAREQKQAHNKYSPVLDMPEIKPELEGEGIAL